ncbi:hypothetical protein ACU4GD_33200 [Cupriavidus basilensis]
MRFAPIENVAAATGTVGGPPSMPTNRTAQGVRPGARPDAEVRAKASCSPTTARSINHRRSAAVRPLSARVLGKTYATLHASTSTAAGARYRHTAPATTCLRPSISVELVLNNFRVTVARAEAGHLRVQRHPRA